MTTSKKILVGCSAAIGIFFIGIIAIFVLAFWGTDGITKVADDQLAALRSGDYAQAYAYTSRDFQSSTSLDEFKAFVDANPALKDNASSYFNDRRMESGQGTLKGSLKSNDGGVTPVTYHLVKENGEWKILNMQVNPAESATGSDEAGTNVTDATSDGTAATTGTGILDVKLSDTVGPGGYVETSKTEFATDTAEILTSAYIRNAQKGDAVQAILTYVQTGDKVGPATNTIQNEGDIISNFSFTQPTKGWPVGDYRVAIKIANGGTKTVDFRIK